MKTLSQTIKREEIVKLFTNLDNLNEHDMALIKKLYNKGYDEIIVHKNSSNKFLAGLNNIWEELSKLPISM